MDYNRTGEALYSVGKYQLAGYKFFSALMLYADNSGEANVEDAVVNQLFKDKEGKTKDF